MQGIQVAIGSHENAELRETITVQVRAPIERPREQLIPPLATNQIIVTLATEKAVEIRRAPIAAAAVTPQPVVAVEAVDRIAARATADAIAAVGAAEFIVFRAAVDDCDPVDAERVQVGDIKSVRALNELNLVVAAQAGDAELLTERCAIGAAPDRLEAALPQLDQQLSAARQLSGGLAVETFQRLAGNGLAEADYIVSGRAAFGQGRNSVPSCGPKATDRRCRREFSMGLGDEECNHFAAHSGHAPLRRDGLGDSSLSVVVLPL